MDGPLLEADARLARLLRHFSPPQAVAELLADLGSMAVAVPVLCAACCYAALLRRPRRWLAPLCALAALGCAAVLVSLVKVWLGRPGPLGGVNYYPSGHTATAAVAYGGAALVLGLSLRKPPHWPLPAAAAALTVLCGAGLVWRQYHWPLDVAASLCLSWVLLASAAAVVRRAHGAAEGHRPGDGTPPPNGTDGGPRSG